MGRGCGGKGMNEEKFKKAVEKCWKELPYVQILVGEKLYTEMMGLLLFKLSEQDDHKTPSLMDQFQSEVQELEAKTGKQFELKLPENGVQ